MQAHILIALDHWDDSFHFMKNKLLWFTGYGTGRDDISNMYKLFRLCQTQMHSIRKSIFLQLKM